MTLLVILRNTEHIIQSHTKSSPINRIRYINKLFEYYSSFKSLGIITEIMSMTEMTKYIFKGYKIVSD